MEKTVRVKVARKHVDKGVTVKVNDEYETDEANAEDLVQLGYVTRIVDPKKQPSYRRRDLTAEK